MHENWSWHAYRFALGFFGKTGVTLRWHKNLWFILLTSSTLLLSDLVYCTTKLDEPRVSYVRCSASRELWGLMEWSLPWIPSSRLDMSCGVATCSYVCIPHVDHARQGYTPFKRRVSEVGRCPCSGFTHGYRFYKWTVMFVDAFVTCWHKRFIFCRYTNRARKSLSANRVASTSYYKESRL
jgi:hypothetical protein